MNRLSLALVTIVFVGGIPKAARAQAPDSARAERLRQLIEDRFAERLSTELALTADQEERVSVVLSAWGRKRREIEREERLLRRELGGEMRPGVAADERKVNRLVDGILDARLAYVQTFKDELRELTGVLTPIQRAQYVLLRDQLQRRVQEVREQRRDSGDSAPFRRRRHRP